MKKVIVVGGGAAGMIAAVAAGMSGAKVLLLEGNEKLGKKIFITGKGRCNVTNAGDIENLLSNVKSNPKFLYSAFYNFDNMALMDFLEKAGCKLKVERGDRVFPVSDHSSDVTAALNRRLNELNVEIRLNCKVKNLVTKKAQSLEMRGEIPCEILGVELENGKKESADSVIIATGGISYPVTGSTGDGYKFATKLGHTVVKCRPSLVPFNCKESWCKELMGVSLKNVELLLKSGKKNIYSGFGEMLFTHFGISGPLVLSASSLYVQKEYGEVQAYIDLKPALNLEQLDKRVLRDFEEAKNKQFKNSLQHLFPQKMIPIIIQLSGINPDTKVNEITREERNNFVTLMKNLPLTVIGVRDYNEAVITKGGVVVKEIDPSTMESKLVAGLYFAGEVLDVDALTGGYNLQIAWSTGYLAGQSAATK